MLTVQNCFFGVNGAYIKGATPYFYSGLAVTGALPTNSVLTFSNNTFYGAIGTTGYNYNANAWQAGGNWPVTAPLAALGQMCSLCLVDFMLLGDGAKLTIANNAFSYNFNSWGMSSANIYAGHMWVEGGAAVAVTNNTFTLFDANNLPQRYALNAPLTQINVSAITFLDRGGGLSSASSDDGGDF